jgi:hypothetical protein
LRSVADFALRIALAADLILGTATSSQI